MSFYTFSLVKVIIKPLFLRIWDSITSTSFGETCKWCFLSHLTSFQCSKTCGNGLKTRPVNCHGLNSQCDVKIKPATRAPCNLGPCAEWKVGDWQQVLLFAECQSPFFFYNLVSPEIVKCDAMYFLVYSYMWQRMETPHCGMYYKKITMRLQD